MILSCVALTIAVSALMFVLWNGWELRRLRRQTEANPATRTGRARP
jgi:hypothetical protein